MGYPPNPHTQKVALFPTPDLKWHYLPTNRIFTQSRDTVEGEDGGRAGQLRTRAVTLLANSSSARPCSPSTTTSQHKEHQDEVTDEALPRKPVGCACVCLAQALKMGSGWEERTEPVRESKDPSSNPSSAFHRSVGLGTRLSHLPISVLHRY